ncbi:MAG: DUF1016 family protein [Deltaproteobacteria bacterium]|nr:DUF1016 family protein [Deltaproteobacteria bacterium]
MSQKEIAGKLTLTEEQLLNDLKILIQTTQEQVVHAVNSSLTQLYWQVGKRIREEVLNSSRAEYGKQILYALSIKLTSAFGKGWSAGTLSHMVKFAEVFPDEEIVSAVRRELSWTHIRTLIYISDPLKRSFYIEMCRLEKWSTRMLQERIDSMLYERTALSKKPEETIIADIEKSAMTGRPTAAMLLKDPYLLDFLQLNDRYMEKDLEDAILRELEQFLLEMGAGFTFVARQKRIVIDGDDFYIDLLFYNRKLKRLVALDLKLGAFKAGYKSQMELYLRWLAKNEQEVVTGDGC